MGLLGEIFSQGDRAKRFVGGLLGDPIGTMAQTAGLLGDFRRDDQTLNARAFADPANPLRVTDPSAMHQLGDRMLAGPLSMAPVGMIGATFPQQVDELLQQITSLPKGQRVGVRLLPDDVPTPNIGDALSPSFKWADGVRQERTLPGTSAMDVSGRTREEVEAAVRRLGLFNTPGQGYYPGNKLAVISGASKRKGEDVGETMIKDAIVRYLTDPPLGPR